MLIPKDATVVIPSYAIHRSEKFNYKAPDEFNPQRYLNHPRLASDYAGSPDFNNRDKSPFTIQNDARLTNVGFEHHYGYGAGRRICPGMHLAERTQWRAIAKLLWAFTIELPVDAAGNKIIPDPEAYKEGIAHGPLPYQVVFKPRSQEHVDIIMRDCERSLKTLQQWE